MPQRIGVERMWNGRHAETSGELLLHRHEICGFEAPRMDISRLSRLTGVKVSTLRSWENRYALMTPARTLTGRRVYVPQDVERLLLIKELLEGGFRLPALSKLSLAELQGLRRNEASPRSRFDHDAVLRLEAAIDERDVEGFANLLRFIFASFSAPVAVDHFSRAMRHIGLRWQEGVIGIGHEHRFTAKAREIVSAATAALAPASSRPAIAFSTLTDERHELGLLAGAYLAAADGHRIIYFGADMPPADLAQQIVTSGASLLVLSVVHCADVRAVGDRITHLVEALPSGFPVWIGAHQRILDDVPLPSSLIELRDYPAFRRQLRIRYGG